MAFDPIPGAGQILSPWVSYPVTLDPNIFRAEIRASPHSERVRWFRALISPTYAKKTASNVNGKPSYIWTEQTVARQVRVKIEDENVVRQYVSAGDIKSGQVAITCMPDEIPLSDHDLFIPIGRYDNIYPYPDSRVFPMLESFTRGEDKVQGVGTISSSGTTITGVGTTFLSSFSPGDLMIVGQNGFIIKSLSSDTSLTVVQAPSCPIVSNSYFISQEQPYYWPIAYIDQITDANGITYDPTTDYAVSADQKHIQWINPNNCPAMGINYSIRYYYYPVYEILKDFGVRRPVVKGVPMPMTLIGSMVDPQKYNNLF